MPACFSSVFILHSKHVLGFPYIFQGHELPSFSFGSLNLKFIWSRWRYFTGVIFIRDRKTLFFYSLLFICSNGHKCVAAVQFSGEFSISELSFSSSNYMTRIIYDISLFGLEHPLAAWINTWNFFWAITSWLDEYSISAGFLTRLFMIISTRMLVQHPSNPLFLRFPVGKRLEAGFMAWSLVNIRLLGWMFF